MGALVCAIEKGKKNERKKETELFAPKPEQPGLLFFMFVLLSFYFLTNR